MGQQMNYKPFDQDAHLGEPPWSPDDPALQAWEKAHGHDVRLKCYVEFGCQVIEPALEGEIEELTRELEKYKELDEFHKDCPVFQKGQELQRLRYAIKEARADLEARHFDCLDFCPEATAYSILINAIIE